MIEQLVAGKENEIMKADFGKSTERREEKASGKTDQRARKDIIDHLHLPLQLQNLIVINAVIITIARILLTNHEHGQPQTGPSSSLLPKNNPIATSHFSLK